MKKIFSNFFVLSILLILTQSCNDKVKTEVSLKNDTLVTKVITEKDKEDLEKNGFYAEEQYVFANKTYLRNEPSKSGKVLDSLFFGSKVYIKSVYYDEYEGNIADETVLENERANEYVAVYASKPKTLSQKPIGYLLEKVLTFEYDFKTYKKYFSLPEFKKLETNIKKIINENSYLNGSQYYLTENAQKAPNAIAYGDFDSDGNKDIAVILDCVEKQQSLVLVLLYNSSTKEPYIAYKTEFAEYLKIKSILKETPTEYWDHVNEKNATTTYKKDILEIYGAETKSFIIYDEATNKLKLI